MALAAGSWNGDGAAQSLVEIFFVTLHLETCYNQTSDKAPLFLLPRQKIFRSAAKANNLGLGMGRILFGKFFLPRPGLYFSLVLFSSSHHTYTETLLRLGRVSFLQDHPKPPGTLLPLPKKSLFLESRATPLEC